MADQAELYCHHARECMQRKDLDQAIQMYRQAIRFREAFPQAHNALANALRAKYMFDEAIVHYQRAITLHPTYALAHYNLGTVLHTTGRLTEAVDSLRRAVSLDPAFTQAWNNLGNTLRMLGDLDGAAEALGRAIAVRPKLPELHSNLGNVLLGAGSIRQATEEFRASVALGANAALASNLLYSLHFQPGITAAQLAEEHEAWHVKYAAHLAPVRRNATRHIGQIPRLRVGYVSAHFREHPVGRFALPMARHHNPDRFELYYYYSARTTDWITRELIERAATFRYIADSSDRELAELIACDGIDILVDLDLHSENNRLLVFARKPAPVQVTYLGYASTTGLTAIDYRVTDGLLEPPGAPPPYRERPVYLPRCYFSYSAPSYGAPPQHDWRASDRGVIFGCLNNFAKVNTSVLDAWCTILRRAPSASMVIHASTGCHRARVRAYFEQNGVAPERVTFCPLLAPAQYFEQYNGIDIALDTFPFNGGTTTCDALWMGVPVVSLAGTLGVSRTGLSILSAIGLRELCSDTVSGYTDLAVSLAADSNRLAQLRSSLPERLRSSALLDGRSFTRSIEKAFILMWESRHGSGPVHV